MTPETRFRLQDMREHARLAIELLGDLSEGEVSADDRTRLALLHAIQIVGEAASRIEKAERALLPENGWEAAVRMRHILVHGYGKVVVSTIVDVVRRDLPILLQQLDPLLEEDDAP